jgi:hypothetical protein
MRSLRWLTSKAGEGIVQGAAWAAVVLAGYLLWHRVRQNVEVPFWVLLLVVGIPATIAIGQTIRRYRVIAEIQQAHAGQMDEFVAEAMEMYRQLQETQNLAYYANHLYEILATLRRVMGGAIPGVKVTDFVEYGVLQPARDLLRQGSDEDVRISILMPDGTGRDWVMRYAAGHSLESRQAFRLPIESSFSKYAYESGEVVWSNNLNEDSRFMRHPQARAGRQYESMISVPIRRGDQAVAVLNVISSEADAFGDEDITYAKLIGAVVEVVVALPGGGGAGLPAVAPKGIPPSTPPPERGR